MRVALRFVKQELALNLIERRLMTAEEKSKRAYDQEQAILEAAKAKSKYAALGAGVFGDEEDEFAGMSAMEKRRLQLKGNKVRAVPSNRHLPRPTAIRCRSPFPLPSYHDSHPQPPPPRQVEKKKIEAEKKLMAAEDVLGGEMRIEDEKQKMLAKLQAELALLGDDSDDDELLDDADDDHDKQEDQARAAEGAAVREARQKAAKAAADKAKAAREAAMALLERDLMNARIKDATAELAWMQTEEEAKARERDLINDTERVRKVSLICQQVCREEMKIKSHARRTREEATKRTNAVEGAVKWLEHCEQTVLLCKRTKLRVERDTKHMDTSALVGRSGLKAEYYQRLTTEQLYARLKTMYFNLLSKNIATRAELVGLERRLRTRNDSYVGEGGGLRAAAAARPRSTSTSSLSPQVPGPHS